VTANRRPVAARSAIGNRAGSSGCRTVRTTAEPVADVAADVGTAAAAVAAPLTGSAAAVGSWPP